MRHPLVGHAASSGHNLLDLDLDRLATDPQRAAELHRFLADLGEWMGTHGRADDPDGHAETWVDLRETTVGCPAVGVDMRLGSLNRVVPRRERAKIKLG